jgi:hypothetical protein
VSVVDELEKILEDIRAESEAAYDDGQKGSCDDTLRSIGKIQAFTFAADKVAKLRTKLSAPTTGAE